LKDEPNEDYFEVSMSLANLYKMTGDKNKTLAILDDLEKRANKEEKLFISELRLDLLNENVYTSPKQIIEKEQLADEQIKVDEFQLHGNYPNPFNPTTTIKYSIASLSNINLTIYDIIGRKIKSFEKEGLSAGQHAVFWDGTNNNGVKVSSGIYIYKFHAISLEGDGKVFEQTKKLMLVK